MRPDAGLPYYTAYDKRYRSAYRQGADHWGHLPGERWVERLASEYVERFALKGKTLVEFGCGDGWLGKVLAGLGCVYQGYDISPAAIEKAKANLAGCAGANATLKDIVLDELPPERFDAGIEVQFLHMLITDADRKKYLQNLHKCLKPGAPFYFISNGFGEDAYEGTVDSYDLWLKTRHFDVDTPNRAPPIKTGRKST